METISGGRGLGLLLVLLLLQGCGVLASRISVDKGRLSGRLLEHRNSEGQVKRFSIGGLEGWQWWDRNALKGDDTAILAKAEITF